MIPSYIAQVVEARGHGEATRRPGFLDLQGAELQRLELEVQGLLGREPIDLAQVETRIRRIESLRIELRLGRIRTVEKGKATLTPEQWRKLQPLIRGGP
mgnify:CR=1 FL=1